MTKKGNALRTLLTAGVAALISCGPGRQSVPAPVSDYDPIQGVASFDLSWQKVADTYFDESFEGLDWNAVRDELRPLAEQARSDDELRRVISRMLRRLDKSHFEVLPAAPETDVEPQQATGWVGLDVRLIGDEVLVTEVAAGTPAHDSGVRTGWKLAAVDGVTIDYAGASRRTAIYAREAVLHRLMGAVGTSVEVSLLDADDRTVERTLDRVRRPGESIELLGLPEYFVGVEARRIASDAGCVGYIAFDMWMLPAVKPFGAALDSLQSCGGVVIDLRGNIGGVGALARGFAGYFVQESGSLGTLSTRDGTIEFIVQPRAISPASGRRDNFAGPVAILTDAVTGSTSEIFAAGLQSLGRARTFGAATAGMALPALIETLPNGDRLLHAVADFTTPDGQLIEGQGVLPDEPVTVDRQALLTGGDPVLDAALRWIETTTLESNSEGTSR